MTYDFGATQERYSFVFAEPDDPELCTLREQYGLESRSFGLFSGAKSALFPLGAAESTVSQRRFPVTETTYTRLVQAFYPAL